MKLYTVRFSNRLYIRNPFFSFDEGLEMRFTSDLNKARLFASYDNAERHAETALSCCDTYPKLYKNVADCSYEIVEVKIVEV